MKSDNNFPEFENIINEMTYVYKHDNRPWIIGYSGGHRHVRSVTDCYGQPQLHRRTRPENV